MTERNIRKGMVEPGTLVAVRPARPGLEGKTHLGIYVGDVYTTAVHAFNPCIFVPALTEYIWGYESWWHALAHEKELKEITNDDIQNVWYVRALAQIAEMMKAARNENPS